MTGVEFLAQAIELQPDAKRVLLTAYADTDAAIKAINESGWITTSSSPGTHRRSTSIRSLDDLLADWHSTFRPSIEGLRVLAGRWSPGGHRSGTT